MKDKSNTLLIFLGLLCGLINGILGSGGGVIAVLLLTHLFKIENKIAHATSILVILPLCIISSFIIAKNGFIDFSLIIKVGAGSVVGGILGAKLLCKLSNKAIRKVFGFIMIISAVRMMF